MMRFLEAAALLFLLAATAPAQANPSSPDAEAADEKLLAAVGGREAWAALSGTVNTSQQNRVAEPSVVTAVITMDFERPRFRIDTSGDDLTLVRVIDGKKSWRKTREGVVENVPAELYEQDMLWYGAHLYRTIHRVARRDAAFSYSMGDDGRLEIAENGARLLWFKLDARGEPYAYGAREDDVGGLSGPWDFSDGAIKHPIWTANATGTWRANLKALSLDPDLDDADFRRP